MIELEQARQILSDRFGYSSFLPGQEASLKSILTGRNLLVVMPTGSGKSLLYQLPALMQDGLTVVISPLISLMKDQVDDLGRKKIPATFINSSLSPDEQRARLHRCANGGIKLLYLAPERFRNAAFSQMLHRLRVSTMAVDEAHCISEWGHDFRPDYLRLREFRKAMGKPRLIALTATATPQVRNDIIGSLGLKPEEIDVHVSGFDRPNLILSVREFSKPEGKDEFLLKLAKRETGSMIVYTSTRGNAEKTGELLKTIEPRTVIYHAGLDPDSRAEFQNRFMSGKDRIVVATCAFGMGIDKADIRSVIHYDFPGSVEQYYQEIGRAGRDGKTSRCILLHSGADRRIREFFIGLSYPGPELVREVYDELFAINDNPVMLTYKEIADRCKSNLKDGHVGSAVRLLDGAGITRAHAVEAMVALTLDKPGSEIMARLRAPIQRRVLEGISATDDIETPGRHEVGLHQLCRACGLSESQVRRALKALCDEGAILYEPPFRGRGIERLVDPPPPFHEVPIDWDRQSLLRRSEEQKLEAMEKYIRYDGCRREFILQYFGEKDSFKCGTCDRCAPISRAGGSGSFAFDRHPEIVRSILICISHLRFPLGAANIAATLTGSRSRKLIEWGVNENPAYGSAPGKGELIRSIIDDLITDGLLKQAGETGRPVLELTELGRERALENRAMVSENWTDNKTSKASRLVELRAAPLEWLSADEVQNGHQNLAEQMASSDTDINEEYITKPMTTDDRESACSVARFLPSDYGIAAAVLLCVAALDKPRDIGSVVEVLTGSKADWIKASAANQIEVYGSVRSSEERIRKVIDSMLQHQLLQGHVNDDVTVLKVTKTWVNELKRLKNKAEQSAGNDKDIDSSEMASDCLAIPKSMKLQESDDSYARRQPSDEVRRDKTPRELDRTAVAILRCIMDIGIPLSKALVVRFALRSRDKRLLARELDKKPLYGLLRGADRRRLSHVMDELVGDGYLKVGWESGRSVLILTHLGHETASAMSIDQLAGKEHPRGAAEKPTSNDGNTRGEQHIRPDINPREFLPSNDASSLLNLAINELIHAEFDRAKEMLLELRLYHPGEIAERLFVVFHTTSENRVKSQAIWSLGELCGGHALDFLIKCTSSDDTSIRRRAVLALGKVAKTIGSYTRSVTPGIEQARRALAELSDDADGYVRRYVTRSLSLFP
ncbi:MAG: RecQ family ATP-dependent DNA helicase [Candidatus Coatesbacteria bacterium]|nr:RecQ family ATP-dependent DNA helicase [Candidatus Coatesbacteria bacterium]